MKTKFIPQFKIIKSESVFEKFKITRALDVVEFAQKMIGPDLDVSENFYIITLNRANITSGFALIGSGGIDSTIVDIRFVAKIAVDNLASSVILVHNHPSGNTTPSSSDDSLSSKIKSAMALFNIAVLDHIIISSIVSFAADNIANYYSYADNNRDPF